MAASRVFSLFLLISVIGVPVTAQAGFLSFIIEMFNIDRNVSVAYETNSQTMPLLQAALNYDPDPSKGGGDITTVDDSALLPDDGPSGTLANIEEGQTSDQISIYVVRPGDSLSQIAKMFNVSVNTIIWSNDIKKGDLIKPGQTLAILPVTGIKHTVVKGDTMASITKKYKGDLEEILQYNDFPTDVSLAIGDTVIVPDGEMAVPQYSSSSASRVVRGSNAPSYAGYYIRPTTGIKTQGLHGYNAIDIGSPVGSLIIASAPGQVIISKSTGWNGGYGKYVVIRHDNGSQTLYAHNSQNIVHRGQYVVQGQVIAYVGSSGNSTGPHTHFEIRGAKNPF